MIYKAESIFTGYEMLHDHALAIEDGIIKRILPAAEIKNENNTKFTRLSCQNLSGHNNGVSVISLVPSCLTYSNSLKLICGTNDNLLKIWNTETLKCECTIKGHNSKVSFISFLPCGKLVIAETDGTTKILGTTSDVFNTNNDDANLEFNQSTETFYLINHEFTTVLSDGRVAKSSKNFNRITIWR